MKLIKQHTISPVYLRSGDTISLNYSYQEEVDGPIFSKKLQLETFDEPTIIDTVIVYKTDGEYGLKAGGRAIILGENNE